MTWIWLLWYYTYLNAHTTGPLISEEFEQVVKNIQIFFVLSRGILIERVNKLQGVFVLAKPVIFSVKSHHQIIIYLTYAWIHGCSLTVNHTWWAQLSDSWTPEAQCSVRTRLKGEGKGLRGRSETSCTFQKVGSKIFSAACYLVKEGRWQNSSSLIKRRLQYFLILKTTWKQIVTCRRESRRNLLTPGVIERRIFPWHEAGWCYCPCTSQYANIWMALWSFGFDTCHR